MIITRDIVNRDIKHHDKAYNQEMVNYSYLELSRMIDAYKNLFIKKGAKKGRSVVIGNQASTSQLALVLACSELGMTIVIIGTPYPAGKKAKDYVPGVVNPKRKQMMPIDYFILDSRTTTNKFDVFRDVCRFTIVIDEEQLDYTPNKDIWADDSTPFIKCTSSGTTDTPKIIIHTHAFMYDLIHRNSKDFYGKMGMLTNLAHGSSPAVYFLPGLISSEVTDYYNLPNTSLTNIASILGAEQVELDHLLVPYTVFIDEFFQSELAMEKCTIHTLGSIRNSWVDKVKQNKVKDIVSIFGTNETSGPFMINKASYDDFSENTYVVPDDFYKVSLNENNDLEVTIPIYNTTVKTHDTFLQRGNKFVHVGRSNLYRINDLEIDIGKYQAEIDKLLKAEIVVDTQKDNIYLAIWDEYFDIHKVRHIDNMMRNDSNNLHFIAKYDSLKYSEYLNGIKIDKEMLREYFRNM